MKVVIDCNVVISAGITTNGICSSVMLKAFKEYTVVVTNAILDEDKTVAKRKRFSSFRNTLDELIRIIEINATKIADITIPGIHLPDINELIYIYAGINSGSRF